MTTLAITFGKKLFQFSSKADWIQNASENWKQHHVQTYRTTCVDQLVRNETLELAAVLCDDCCQEQIRSLKS